MDNQEPRESAPEKPVPAAEKDQTQSQGHKEEVNRCGHRKLQARKHESIHAAVTSK